MKKLEEQLQLRRSRGENCFNWELMKRVRGGTPSELGAMSGNCYYTRSLIYIIKYLRSHFLEMHCLPTISLRTKKKTQTLLSIMQFYRITEIMFPCK